MTPWCTDEDIAVRCGPDFTVLLPNSQILAEASDGVFASGDRWAMTSATTNFETQLPASWGLTPSRAGYVLWLKKPSANYQAGGQLLAIYSATGTSLALRRIGMADGAGQPPGPAAGLTGIGFQVATFAPQIDEITYAINQQFNIGLPGRNPTDLADVRPLRRLCVAMVLLDRYSDESRASTGDYAAKTDSLKSEISDLRGQLTLRWGNRPSSEATNIFSTRTQR